ncbi:MAG: DUF2264 domain-containing protein [Lachnospiraceae bacterium]|nr:DUF2264 domain-containing protein [Lachnospiraceae bacterium]
MAFIPKTLDKELSPYTGFTRQTWIEAATWMLEGIFHHIKNFDDPVILPRSEREITYPHAGSSPVWQQVERRAEIFEGLTRSLFIAAPLLAIDPELTVCGKKMAEYYRSQILHSCTQGDPLYVGTYQELYAETGCEDPFRCFQQTVETCALVIGLWTAREALWEKMTREEKDTVARFLEAYACSPTVPQNWRLFNMLDLAFLDNCGYEIDHAVMMDHAQAILNYSVGDGWYRDGQSFDYYSCWAFNVYAPLWNLWYGYEKAPGIAARFEEQLHQLMQTYPDFFDAEGRTQMWGRSNIYRCASVSPFAAWAMLCARRGIRDDASDPAFDFGNLRRICSGSLMQFFSREDFAKDGVPSMGFYGQFAPLVQGYSCTESPLWLGKVFLCLEIPEDHPFWTAQETNGDWGRLSPGQTLTTVLDGPALCFTDHEANGSVTLRTGKVRKHKDDIHGMWNYSKLSYHSRLPWEASAPGDDAESQQYMLLYPGGEKERANVTFWTGELDGVLYRRQYFGYCPETETHWNQAVDLADFAVAKGLFRADRLRLLKKPVTLTLGSYGFPDNGTEVTRLSSGEAACVILKGRDAQGVRRSMAMTVYGRHFDLQVRQKEGTNPDSPRSLMVVASCVFRRLYDSTEPYVMLSQVITAEGDNGFSEEELFPVEAVRYADPMGTGGSGPVILEMKDGRQIRIDYDEIQGKMML